MNGSFVHLHVHTEYSLLDGAARIDKLVDQAKRAGFEALAVTDHGVMYGVIPFYKACKKAGIRPIIGCEVYLTPDRMDVRPTPQENRIHHLLLLAETNEGYRNLMKIVSEAHLRGFHYKPRVDKELLRRHHQGLIATSGCLAGEIPQTILEGNLHKARRLAQEYREIFGENHFFLELQDHGILEQQRVNRHLLSLSQSLNIPLVATNDVHYVDQADHEMHDCLLCIGTNRKLAEKDRLRFPTDQFYMKSAEEMERQFAHVPEAVKNTRRIAERCRVEIPLGGRLLPRFPLPDGYTASSYLRERCEQGVRERYGKASVEVRQRLDVELSVIENMGFSDYFLIVWDFVRFARERGIAVGPGRGSAAGSLVSYVLNITDIDPIRYRLLFERFLNPERVSMPDIDIDFNYERRDEVIEYVTRKYGANRVAQIITFGTMAPRAAVRDVGRVMGLPYAEVDKVARMIPAGPGRSLDQVKEKGSDLDKLIQENAQIARMMETVQKVEGFPRHASTHAAGVVISQRDLTEDVPLERGNEGIRLTQYPMEALEEIGLLKADFLGLRYLTVIEHTIESVRKTTGCHIDFSGSTYDDPATYQMLSTGETTGVFQLESSGMRNVLRDLKPNTFEDLIAVLALYRPGPMEQIPRFIRAKHGKEAIHYPHPNLEPILKDTYGIIVYQEQIMQIAAQMAGFSLGQADILRRAVSKKKHEVLEEQRKAFVKGCMNQGYSEETGHAVYDLIVRFADYGFNRSHSAAYAVLAYQTAFLKANYPLQFMAALLTTVMENHKKMAAYIEDCRRNGIVVLPPDINESERNFSVGNGVIRMGLAAVKNVGTHAITSILEERQKRPYRDLIDFCRRVNLRTCNRRVIESLIQCGAMDTLPGHRALRLAMLDEALEQGGVYQQQQSEDQLKLFDPPEKQPTRFSYEGVKPYHPQEILGLERELLGLYLTGHPLDDFRKTIDAHTSHTLNLLERCREGERVSVAGLVRDVKTITTRKGEPMAFVTLEDFHSQTEAVIFPRTLRQYRALLQTDQPVRMSGRVNRHENGIKLLADTVEDLKRFMEAERQMIYIRIPSDKQEKPMLNQLKRVLASQKGKIPVRLFYEGTRQVVELPVEKYGVSLSGELKQKVQAIMGTHSFHVQNSTSRTRGSRRT